MTWSALQLRHLSFLGPEKQPASLTLRSGVNVICGASDTGKSFLVEAIDFLFGGNDPLRDIPERVGYNRGRLALRTSNDELYTLERSTEGGNFSRYEGFIEAPTSQDDIVTILRAAHAHGREDNLSGWLLANIGLLDKRLRKNSRGETRSLSFRDLARLVVVQENEIIRRGSMFLSGQYTTKTAETSTLKLLLTGVDDSALVASDSVARGRDITAAKTELLDELLADLQDQVTDIGSDRPELEDQLKRLEEAIAGHRKHIAQLRQNLDDKIKARNSALSEKQEIKSRIVEIGELLRRFALLKEHYLVDLERLAAIEESGTLFFFQEPVSCPLCGASPSEQHRETACEGNVELVILAAQQETNKIRKLSEELDQTVADLQSEAKQLNSSYVTIEEKFVLVDSEIKGATSPELGTGESMYADLLEKREELRRALDVFAQIDKLNEQRMELSDVPAEGGATPAAPSALPRSVLDQFSRKVESILQSWHFPGAERVYFDETSLDFVINGKPRASRGKGLRAITHSAVTIALLEFCREHSLPHPGFVILDSPLLAYWAPEGADDSLQGTDLKDKFYEYLISNHQDSQIVLVENEHPPEHFVNDLSLTIFTKNPNQGRFGFFPSQSSLG